MTGTQAGRPTVAVLVNLVSPYRVPVLEAMGELLGLVVLVEGAGRGRNSWFSAPPRLDRAEVRPVRGLRLGLRARVREGGIFDRRFLHLGFGHLLELNRLRPDAVISTEMGFRSVVALGYGALYRVPVWIWWGGTRHTEQNLGPVRRAVRWVLARWCRRWISYGTSSTSYLASLGIPADRVLQIQNCVDDRRFEAESARTLDLAPRPVIGYVGQLIGRKGVDHLVRAAARVQAGGLQFSLLIVGEGPGETGLRALADELGVGGVHFHPAQPNEAMPGIYRSLDCLVLPTLEDVWGLVVNEALWSGVPVIASRYAGCAGELLPPGNLFDPLDEQQLTVLLERAVRGEIDPADPKTLLRAAEVGRLISDEVARALAP